MWVTVHIRMNHITHFRLRVARIEWVMSHMWIVRVTQRDLYTYAEETYICTKETYICTKETYICTKETYIHTQRDLDTHKRELYTYTQMNEACHTYEWFTSHMQIRHVTQPGRVECGSMYIFIIRWLYVNGMHLRYISLFCDMTRSHTANEW